MKDGLAINEEYDRNAEQRRRFGNEIAEYPQLNPKEEIELFRQRDELRKSEGNEKEINKLENRAIEASLLNVWGIAHQYAKKYRVIKADDLVNIGTIGFLEGVKRFDWTRGNRLFTYAKHWIRQSMLLAIIRESSIIKYSDKALVELRSIERTIQQLIQGSGGVTPSISEIAAATDHSEERINDILQARESSREPFSLDEHIGDNPDDRTMGEVLGVASPELNPTEGIEVSQLGRDIEKMLVTFTPREAEILRLYYGIGYDRPYTLEEIGQKFNVKRQRILQIKQKVFEKMHYRQKLLEKLKEHY